MQGKRQQSLAAINLINIYFYLHQNSYNLVNIFLRSNKSITDSIFLTIKYHKEPISSNDVTTIHREFVFISMLCS